MAGRAENLLLNLFWMDVWGNWRLNVHHNQKNNMKNWITIIEDGDSIITAHFPINRVSLVLEAQDRITIDLEKGSIKIEGVGVEKLVPKLLAGDLPVLKSGVAGIKSVKFDRELEIATNLEGSRGQGKTN
jgi:hypothetical protein